MRNGADPRNRYGDKMWNGTDLDKMCHFNEFFASFFTFLCFRFMFFFVMEYNVVVFIIHNISYTAISIKVVTERIVKCTIWALK
jgi:hypothetical protein